MHQYLATYLWNACFISCNRTACMPMTSTQSPREIKATLIASKMKKKTSTQVSLKKNLLRLNRRPSLRSMRTYLLYSAQKIYRCRL